MRREGFGIRLGAALIDLVVLNGLMSPFLLIMAGSLIKALFLGVLIPFTDGHSGPDAERAMSAAGIAMSIIFLLAFAYSLCDVFLAGTPGKLLLKLRIRNADGEPAQRAQLLRRWVLKYSWLLLDAFLIGIVQDGTVFWTAQLVPLAVIAGFSMTLSSGKQALHDTFAETAVYRSEAGQKSASI